MAVVPALLATLLASASVSPVPVVASGAALSDQMVTTLSATPQSETRNPDGSVTDTWTVDGVPVSVTGPPQTTVTTSVNMVNGHRFLVAGATPPAQAKTAKSSTQAAVASSAWTYRSWCVTMTPSNGYGRACDLQQMLSQNGGDWYLSDAMTMSAHYGNGFFSPSLEFMYVYAKWSANNSEVQWSPTSNGIDVGNCQQTSVGVAYIVSVSETWTVCPVKWGLYTLNSTQFGSYWSGQSQNWEGVDAVDVVHDPPNASPGTTLYAYMYWN
ncbi:MAG: hypothetical protein JOY80_03390 [Candidatus Dormibacteraeota bacterium]|nr:hypothetical protein [Candidatus Dormibacteraeota bacterium]